MFENSRVTVADVSDGTSNTILLGELTGGLGVPVAIGDPTIVNARHSIMQNGMGGSFGYFGDFPADGGFFSTNRRSMFSSFHNSGSIVNFSFCDGSTRSISSNTERNVMNQLMTRASQDDQ